VVVEPHVVDAQRLGATQCRDVKLDRVDRRQHDPELHQDASLAAHLHAPRQPRPIAAWAAVGALFWAFQAFVLIKWVTGPYFTSVKSGPDDPRPR